ncbi:hydrogenase maturation protease [Streptomyces ovatisporus]|uniref:Hydrogenase maturation protease n=1 Tax=Streptomyces ovatisporus TaxID=1128682 RepID=A0ABV9A9I2_9ACTN
MSPREVPSRTVVLGVGNSHRRDDGVGPAVVARLVREAGHGLLPHSLGLHVSDGEPARLITLWQGAGLAVIVDAARTRRPAPGRVHRLEDVDDAVRPAFAASSHGLGISEAVRLARVLDRLPPRLVIYGVEIADTGFGTGLSAGVAGAVPGVAARVRQDIVQHGGNLHGGNLHGGSLHGGNLHGGKRRG